MAFIDPMHRNKPNITYLITVRAGVGCIMGYTVGVSVRPSNGATW